MYGKILAPQPGLLLQVFIHWLQAKITDLYTLSDDEVARYNPPSLPWFIGMHDELYEAVLDDPKWLNVGYIPRPRRRFGWLLYHVIHGLAMRYPVHKVLLYAVCHTAPREEVLNDDRELSVAARRPHRVE